MNRYRITYTKRDADGNPRGGDSTFVEAASPEDARMLFDEERAAFGMPEGLVIDVTVELAALGSAEK